MASESSGSTQDHQHAAGGDGGVLSETATLVGSQNMNTHTREHALTAVFNTNNITEGGAGLALGMALY